MFWDWNKIQKSLRLMFLFLNFKKKKFILFVEIHKSHYNFSFAAVRMEHLLTTKSFKGMVRKLSFNMEILCHLLVHQSMVNLFI